jgi:hypothetical protein
MKNVYVPTEMNIDEQAYGAAADKAVGIALHSLQTTIAHLVRYKDAKRLQDLHDNAGKMFKRAAEMANDDNNGNDTSGDC